MDNTPVMTIDFSQAESERRRGQVSSPTAVFDVRLNPDAQTITFTAAGVNRVVPDSEFPDGGKTLENYSLHMLHFENAQFPVCLVFVPKGEGTMGNKGMKGGRIKAPSIYRILHDASGYNFQREDVDFCLVRVNDWEGFPTYAMLLNREDTSSFRRSTTASNVVDGSIHYADILVEEEPVQEVPEDEGQSVPELSTDVPPDVPSAIAEEDDTF